MSEKTETNDTTKRVIFIRAPRFMSDAEVAAALGSMADDDPRWLAMNQLLDVALATATYDASSPTQRRDEGTYAGGQVAALAELKSEWHRMRRIPVAAASASKSPVRKASVAAKARRGR